MKATSVKHEAQRMVAELEEGATWDDLMYKIYVRQAIEKGLQDSEAERTLDIGQVRAKFGLNSGHVLNLWKWKIMVRNVGARLPEWY